MKWYIHDVLDDGVDRELLREWAGEGLADWRHINRDRCFASEKLSKSYAHRRGYDMRTPNEGTDP